MHSGAVLERARSVRPGADAKNRREAEEAKTQSQPDGPAAAKNRVQKGRSTRAEKGYSQRMKRRRQRQEQKAKQQYQRPAPRTAARAQGGGQSQRRGEESSGQSEKEGGTRGLSQRVQRIFGGGVYWRRQERAKQPIYRWCYEQQRHHRKTHRQQPAPARRAKRPEPAHVAAIELEGQPPRDFPANRHHYGQEHKGKDQGL